MLRCDAKPLEHNNKQTKEQRISKKHFLKLSMSQTQFQMFDQTVRFQRSHLSPKELRKHKPANCVKCTVA